MKVRIDATQDELERKRPELLKALAGNKFKVSLRKAEETTAGEPRKPYYKAQEEMLEYWDEVYKKTIKDILEDIKKVL